MCVRVFVYSLVRGVGFCVRYSECLTCKKYSPVDNCAMLSVLKKIELIEESDDQNALTWKYSPIPHVTITFMKCYFRELH